MLCLLCRAATAAAQDLTISGNLILPYAGAIYRGASPFIYSVNPISPMVADGQNLFVGDAGNLTMAPAADPDHSIAQPQGYQASRNFGFGRGVLKSLTTGYFNYAFGYNSLNATTSGAGNVAIGGNALPANVSGMDNLAIGDDALMYHSAGDFNIAVGHLALYSQTQGTQNTALGYQSLYFNTTGSYNTALGSQALYRNTAGSNTAVGFVALYSNTGGINQVAIGTNAGYHTTGSGNTAVGQDSLGLNTSGSENTAVGEGAVYAGSGDYRVGVGAGALLYNTDGTGCTAIGYGAGKGSSSPETASAYNTFIGYYAGLKNVTGSNNIYIGYAAGSEATTGSHNIIIGDAVTLSDAPAASNVTMLGHMVFGTETVTADAVAGNHETIVSNNSDTAITISLPAAAAGLAGRKYTIKNIGAAAVTVDAGATGRIDGARTRTLAQWHYIIVECGLRTGTLYQWFVISDNSAVTTTICPLMKLLGDDNTKLQNLRYFRDSKLANSAIGRRIIQIYYTNAGAINTAFELSSALRQVTRRVLEIIAPLVDNKNQG